jgi:hypothetical protein
VSAPSDITSISSTNPDFKVPDPSDLQAPADLNAGCPTTCFIGVTFAPPNGKPWKTETGELHVQFVDGTEATYPLSGMVVPPGEPVSQAHNGGNSNNPHLP